MRTEAPLLTLPKTFSAQMSFSVTWRKKGRLTIWYFAVFKNQFTRVTSTHTDLVKLLVRRESFTATLDDECSYAFRSLLGVRFRIYNKRRRNGSVRNPGVWIYIQSTSFETTWRLSTYQNLFPFSLQPRSVLSAFSRMLMTSLPDPGSLIAKLPTFFPETKSGKYFAFCSSVPCR